MLKIPRADYTVLLYGPTLIGIEADRVVEEDYESLDEVRAYMREVTLRFDALGLAAPQIGIFKQLIVFETAKGEVFDMVNPVITRMYGKECVGVEGCLSLPPFGNECLVPRMERIQVEYSTVERPWRREERVFEKQDAVVIQHEMDHMTGTFFIDRVGQSARWVVLERFEQWKKEKQEYAKSDARPKSVYRL